MWSGNVICHQIAWLYFYVLTITTQIFIYSLQGNLKSTTVLKAEDINFKISRQTDLLRE
jgi:hypothetical protein